MCDDAPTLGSIEQVSLRSVWTTEDRDFTPWLAKTENLALLSDAIQVGTLTVQGTEVRIGEFYADIVARDEQEQLVVIENQFGDSDHDHLGKALTYLAGVEKAKKLVWVAEHIRDRHRAVIDWLNANTPEDVAFFGVEVELLRIDGSVPAPRFNIVCKPNNWSRRATRQASSGTWTEENKWFFGYWSAFANLLEQRNAAYLMRPIPTNQWWGLSLGTEGFRVYATVRRTASEARVEMQIDHRIAEEAFAELVAHKVDIERAFGGAMIWEAPQPGRQRAKIYIAATRFDFADEPQWQQQHEWFLSGLEAFRRAFKNRLPNLMADPPARDAQDGTPRLP